MDPYDWLGYRRRWQLLSLFAGRPVSSRAPIVIGGCGRSGTTLLRVLLGRHPQIAAGPESTVFLKRISAPADIGRRFGFDPAAVAAWQRESRNQIEFVERVEEAVLRQAGKTVWAEKTPDNVLRFDFIRRHFPKARLVHVVRDGRDVVCSLRQQIWAKPRGARGSLDELRGFALYWARRVASGRRFAGDPQYFEIGYEHLVADPERELRSLLEFLGLEWSAALLDAEGERGDDDESRARSPITGSAVGTWRDRLLPAERRCLCAAIGELLVELGYEPDLRWGEADPPRPAALSSPPRKRGSRATDRISAPGFPLARE